MVFNAPTAVDAVRTLAARVAVVSGGRVVARTTPARTTVSLNGRDEEVTFLR